MQFNANKLPPVQQDQFRTWLNDPVTEHLFKDLEHAYFDSVIDPLPTGSIDALTIEALKREGRREFVDKILEWVPLGCNEDED